MKVGVIIPLSVLKSSRTISDFLVPVQYRSLSVSLTLVVRFLSLIIIVISFLTQSSLTTAFISTHFFHRGP